MELKKLIERLPIVFRGKSEDYADEGEIPIIVFRESDYLALMDQYEGKKPAWEPGTVLTKGDGWIKWRLHSFVRRANNEGEEWTAHAIDGCVPHAANMMFEYRLYRVHRLPHEFKVGDWFEYTDARKSLGVMRAETEIFCEYARHVPPPKGENPKKRAWDLGPVGGKSSDCVPPLREILCECEYGLQGEDHAKGCPEIAAVETSEKLCATCGKPRDHHGHVQFGNDADNPRKHEFETPARPDPFQGPHWDDPLGDPEGKFVMLREKFYAPMLALFKRTEDLRDELLRMRGGE